jgi:hypothetical protein
MDEFIEIHLEKPRFVPRVRDLFHEIAFLYCGIFFVLLLHIFDKIMCLIFREYKQNAPVKC